MLQQQLTPTTMGIGQTVSSSYQPLKGHQNLRNTVTGMILLTRPPNDRNDKFWVTVFSGNQVAHLE